MSTKNYSDGDVEEDLLELFTNTPLEKRSLKIEEILSSQPTWAEIYHLSPTRENLLNWLEFDPRKSILEVGSGCGALTGLLAKSGASVVALELSERRSNINKARNGHFSNINFATSNLEDYKTDKKFDYITCIGVLEYSGMFIENVNPYEYFLNKINSLLKPGGQLILAIENRLGIKYLSGAREDHTGRFYDSIEDYPGGTKVKTFGKNELDLLLKKCGFIENNFYFPFPDYKMPSFVHNSKFLDSKKFYFPYSAFPTPSPDQGRLHVFNEQLSIKQFIDNNMYEDIANSFLTISTKRGTNK